MSKKTCKSCPTCQGVVCERRRNMVQASDEVLTSHAQADLLFASIRNKASRRGLVCEVEWKDIHRLIRARQTCPFTGIPFDERRGTHLPFRRSVDRRDNSVGYTRDNIWIICNAANKMKGIYSLETIMYIVRHTCEFQDGLSVQVKERNQLAFDFSGMSDEDVRNLDRFQG